MTTVDNKDLKEEKDADKRLLGRTDVRIFSQLTREEGLAVPLALGYVRLTKYPSIPGNKTFSSLCDGTLFFSECLPSVRRRTMATVWWSTGMFEHS